MTASAKFPGWRHMTGVQRRNARMHAMFERAIDLKLQAQAERALAPGYDPTCIFCHNGEEPGHEH